MNEPTFEPTISLDEYAAKARIRMIVHAEKAIDVLEYQLVTAKSPARIARLKSKIAEYQTALETLRKSNDKKDDEANKAE